MIEDYPGTPQHAPEDIAPIMINLPKVRSTLPPDAATSLLNTFNIARVDAEAGVIILTGASTEGERQPDSARRP